MLPIVQYSFSHIHMKHDVQLCRDKKNIASGIGILHVACAKAEVGKLANRKAIFIPVVWTITSVHTYMNVCGNGIAET